MLQDFRPLLYHYARKGLHVQLQSLCDYELSKRGQDVNLVFWKAYALGHIGKVAEAIGHLNTIKGRGMELAIYSAMLYFHNKASTVDVEQVQMLEAMLQTSVHTISASGSSLVGVLMAVRFLLLTDQYSRAMECLEPFIAQDEAHSQRDRFGARFDHPQSHIDPDALALKCWAAVFEHNNHGSKDTYAMLNETNARLKDYIGDDVEVLMARASCLAALGQNSQALDLLSQVCGIEPSYFPALAEKAQLLTIMQEWDQALDAAHQALELERDDLDCLRLIAVHAFFHQIDLREAVLALEKYQTVVVKCGTPPILVGAAALFSRICGRSSEVLRICQNFLDRALTSNKNPSDHAGFREKLAPEVEVNVLNERGHVALLQKDFDRAMRAFTDASKVDNANIEAFLGMLRCQVMQRHFDDATAQLEVLNMLQSSTDDSPQLPFIKALLTCKDNSNDKAFGQAYQLLHQAKSLQPNYISPIASLAPPVGDNFSRYISRDPDLMLEISSCILNLASSESEKGGADGKHADQVAILVNDGVELLDKLSSFAPAITQSYILKARALSTLGKWDDARLTVQRCLELNPRHTSAHLLEAQLCISQDDWNTAERSIEEALASDFDVRGCALYRLVKAELLAKQGLFEAAIDELEQAINMPETAHNSFGFHNDALLHATSFPTLTNTDRVRLYIQYATLLAEAGRLNEAQRILGDASMLFKGTAHEFSIIEARASYLMKRGDLDEASRVLDTIPASSAGYRRAVVLRGQIFLNRRDKLGYVECYRSLVRQLPSPESYIMLGEAFMTILAPTSAIEAFKEALRQEQNADLQCRLARAYITTHDYNRAVKSYEAALLSNTQDVKRHIDLAKLYCQLDEHDLAIETLEKCAEQRFIDKSKHIDVLIALADTYQLVEPTKALAPIKLAVKLQKEVVTQARGTAVDQVWPLYILACRVPTEAQAKALLASIYRREGDTLAKLNDLNQAVSSYRNAISTDTNCTDAHVQLSVIYIKIGNIDNCLQHCEAALRLNPLSKEAVMVLVDAQLRKRDLNLALKPLEDYLSQSPNDYEILREAITLFRRAGRLDDAHALILAAEKANSRASAHPGLRFCKGLYFRFRNNTSQAVLEFNKARRDAVYGEPSLIHLIELYLNPEQHTMWEQIEKADHNDPNLAVVDALLEELGPIIKDRRKFQILQGYAWMARSRTNIAKAMQLLVGICERDSEYVPGCLASATGYMLDNNQTKAKSLLKTVANKDYNPIFAEEYESCLLLLAKFYVDKGKFDLAQDCCNKCLSYNQSCGAAWEIMGAIMEREQSFVNAANCYEHAWKLQHATSATVGFKLAFNYLKSQQYVEAIDICDKILEQFPDYQIREEILDKALDAIHSYD